MRKRSTRRTKFTEETLPPLLARLAQAKYLDGDKESAMALRALGHLALVTIPTRGVFAPADEDDLFQAIDDVARNHLGLNALRDEIKKSVGAVADFNRRDAIETAYNAFRTASDRVYFYTGLAFGVTIAGFGDSSWRQSRAARRGRTQAVG